MLNISEIVKKTEEMFDLFNQHFYSNELTRPATAEAHGLHIEKHPKYGWTVTTLAPKAEAWIISALGDTGIHASRLQAAGSSQRRAQKIHQPKHQIYLPLLRHHHTGNPRGQCNLRRLQGTF